MTQTIRIPLLRDNHSHPLLYAAFGQSLSLLDTTSKTDAEEMLRQAIDESTSGITVAHGWRSNEFSWTQSELDAFPGPVAIFNISLHSLLLNQSGKRALCEIYGDVVNNVGDQVWYEFNLRTVLNWFANLGATADALTTFFDSMLNQGVYHVEEMLLVGANEIELFDAANLGDQTRFWAAPGTFASLSPEHQDRVHGLKLFTDGALGARTASMNRPFISPAGPATNVGMLIYSDDELTQTIQDCVATNKSLAIHAIGDRAIEQVIDSLEKSGDAIRRAPEIRIEHAQMIDRDLARRTRELGVKLSMQPNFSIDSVCYEDRMDSQYCEMNNPFRMLIDEIGFVPGVDLIFGSDGMPHGIDDAIRQSLFPSEPNQKLSIDEFVAGYCMESDAYGSIELIIDTDQVISTTIVLAELGHS